MTKFITAINFLILFMIFPGCNNHKNDELLFNILDVSKTNIHFKNEVIDQEKFNILTFRNYYNGGGVAIGDINNDGLEDIFFTSNMGDNQLYLNKGNLTFENISAKAGITGKGYWSTGVALADVNADGFLDIYVCNSGDLEGKNRKNELFINKGNLQFKDEAEGYGLADEGYSTHASFFDMDNDGDLDCFVLNNSYTDPQRISQTASGDRFNYGAPGGDRIYKNEKGNFVDFTKESNIFSGDIDFGLGVSISDINNDMLPDIYISNDFWERDYFYLNLGGGKFKEELTERFSYISANSMGSDIADLNNDGYADIFTTDMLPSSNKRLKSSIKLEEYTLEDIKWRNSYFFQYIQNSLQINNGDGTFKETAHFSNVSATDWSWGALIGDFDNDGLKDIFVSNGIYHDITDLDFIDFLSNEELVKKTANLKNPTDFRPFAKIIPNNAQQNYLFMNNGQLRFENKAAVYGMNQKSFSNGSAYGDLDNDGDLEIVVNNVNEMAFLYKNNSKNNYLQIQLKGTGSNLLGIGAKVKVFTSTGFQEIQNFPARGFQSCVSNILHFGFSDQSKIDSIQIIWPDFTSQVIHDGIKINTKMVVYQRNATQAFKPLVHIDQLVFTAQQSWLDYAHKENKYHDFDHERLMPHGLSSMSPSMTKGDIDQDGDEDIVLLGAKNSGISVYVNSDHKFDKKTNPHLEMEIAADKVSSVLIDIDNDGDKDLIVGMGGNEYQDNPIVFSTKFYLNDGKGFFVPDNTNSNIIGNVGCIKSADFDNDGDMDLFIGGKAVPGAYGLIPRSWVLRNEANNSFTDVTDDVTGPLGMISDATWVDLNHDKYIDLIVVGEWMPITYLINNAGKHFSKFEIKNSEGWWNCISSSDLDADGDTDFVVGNFGENFKLQASIDKPLALYTGDFDFNKKSEPLLEWYTPEDDLPYPFASKFDLLSQLPSLKKKNLKYSEYSKRQIKDLFSPEVLNKIKKSTTKILSTCILWNDNHQLILERMPDEAQMSSTFAISIEDFDHDGIKDIFLGGNFYKVKPEIGRLDGFNGGYFKGSKNKKFTFITAAKSGLKCLGEVRSAITINDKLIISRNNDTVLTYKF